MNFNLKRLPTKWILFTNRTFISVKRPMLLWFPCARRWGARLWTVPSSNAACFNASTASSLSTSSSSTTTTTTTTAFVVVLVRAVQRRADRVSVRRDAADRTRGPSRVVPVVAQSRSAVGRQRAADPCPRHSGVPPGRVPPGVCPTRGTQLRRRQPRLSAAALVPSPLRRGREDSRTTAWSVTITVYFIFILFLIGLMQWQHTNKSRQGLQQHFMQKNNHVSHSALRSREKKLKKKQRNSR